MNRINNLFINNTKNILSVYFTAGYPNLNDTTTIINTLSKSGADLIEIGIPFSDPLADGPTIQNSSEIALKNGMSLKLLFEQLANIRKTTNIPLILMGYLNSVIQYGVESFCKKCKETGIDGLILPDLPTNIYVDNYADIFKKYDLKTIFLITPQTDNSRIKYIDSISDSFIYMVSSASTTGAKSDISEAQQKYFQKISNMNLKNPKLIGFGISDKKTFESACQFAEGAIIGSAFIKALTNSKSIEKNIENFVTQIKGLRPI